MRIFEDITTAAIQQRLEALFEKMGVVNMAKVHVYETDDTLSFTTKIGKDISITTGIEGFRSYLREGGGFSEFFYNDKKLSVEEVNELDAKLNLSNSK